MLSVHCPCKRYRLGRWDVLQLLPSADRHNQPRDFMCPECGLRTRATLKSKIWFVMLLLVNFVGMVYVIDFLASLLNLGLGDYTLLVSLPISLCLQCFVIWPGVLVLEES